MPDIAKLSALSLQALKAAEEVRLLQSSKIASQEAEINRLRSQQQGAEQFRALVAKLASVGVVDRLNAVYFDKNVTDENVTEFITKLASAVDTPKQKTTVSPYEVTGVTEQSTNRDQAAGDCERKLRDIVGR